MTLLVAIAAVVVGAALSASGATLQCVLRNPIAEPYLLGTVGGAALFAASSVALGLDRHGEWVMPLSAFLGASFSLALVCATSWIAARRKGVGGFDTETTVLAGYVAGSVCGSADMAVLSFCSSEDFARVSKWLYGDLASVAPVPLAVASLAALAAVVALFSCCRRVNALSLGDDVAKSVGVNVRATWLVALGSASLATAASVSLAGAIGFIGLVVPQVVKRIVGTNQRAAIPLSAAVGAAFLVAAQFLAMRLGGGRLPVGVVCALAGGPFFFWVLIWRRRR